MTLARLLLLGIMLGSAVSAHPAVTVIAAQSAFPADADALVVRYWEQFNAGEHAKALRTANSIKVDRSNAKALGILNAMRGAALQALGREKEAAPLFAEADKLVPESELPLLMQMQSALYAKKPKLALQALDGLIARFPDQVRGLDQRLIGYVMRQAPAGDKKANDDRFIKLAQIGVGDEESRDYAAFEAMELLIERGDAAGARELLQQIDSPVLVENLLILRRFADLWPEVEHHAGPRLDHVRQLWVALAERGFAEDPNSRKLAILANALRHAGRLDEAIALRSQLPRTSVEMSNADEQVGWAVNNVALALHAAGRAEEADQLFGLLNDAPIKEDAWRVNMKINRLELLVSDRRFDKAAVLVEPTAAAKGSPYADQLVRRLRYCTLVGLGRLEEAKLRLPEVLKHADDALHATVDGLLCAGDLQTAEQLALKGLAGERTQADFVRALQPRQLSSDDPSKWQAQWILIRKRPAVAKKYQEVARDLPAKFSVAK